MASFGGLVERAAHMKAIPDITVRANTDPEYQTGHTSPSRKMFRLASSFQKSRGDRLPEGQHRIRKWPMLHGSVVPEMNPACVVAGNQWPHRSSAEIYAGAVSIIAPRSSLYEFSLRDAMVTTRQCVGRCFGSSTLKSSWRSLAREIWANLSNRDNRFK